MELYTISNSKPFEYWQLHRGYGNHKNLYYMKNFYIKFISGSRNGSIGLIKAYDADYYVKENEVDFGEKKLKFSKQYLNAHTVPIIFNENIKPFTIYKFTKNKLPPKPKSTIEQYALDLWGRKIKVGDWVLYGHHLCRVTKFTENNMTGIRYYYRSFRGKVNCKFRIAINANQETPKYHNIIKIELDKNLIHTISLLGDDITNLKLNFNMKLER